MGKSTSLSTFDIYDKTILVVGSSGGIGSAFIKLATQSGARVISASRSQGDSDKEVGSSQPTILGAQSINLDLADPASVDEAIRLLLKLTTPIDAVVFSAGAAHGALTSMTRISDLHEVFEVNAFGPFRVLQGISRKLGQNASCVFVSSVSSVIPQRGNTVYGSSKAALERMALGFALELKDFNVRVNVIRPGPVETQMLKKMDALSKTELLNRSIGKSVTSPTQIANLIAFLISEVSEPLTGTVLSLDGGW